MSENLCNCNANNVDLRYHDDLCPYRLVKEKEASIKQDLEFVANIKKNYWIERYPSDYGDKTDYEYALYLRPSRVCCARIYSHNDNKYLVQTLEKIYDTYHGKNYENRDDFFKKNK